MNRIAKDHYEISFKLLACSALLLILFICGILICLKCTKEFDGVALATLIDTALMPLTAFFCVLGKNQFRNLGISVALILSIPLFVIGPAGEDNYLQLPQFWYCLLVCVVLGASKYHDKIDRGTHRPDFRNFLIKGFFKVN